MHRKTLFLTLFLALLPVVLLAEPPQSPVKPTKYVVKSGDCLWTISREILKDPLKWPLIYTANEGKIGNPNLIYPGQRFAIPSPSAITKADLREATRVAYAKAIPLSGRRSTAKPVPVAMDRAAPSAAAPSPPVKEEGLATGKEGGKTASPPAAKVENPSIPAASTPGNGSTGLVVLVVVLVFVGGFFLWKKMGPGPTMAQEPRPLSTFPEVRNVIPMPDPQPKAQPAEPPMHSGVITSVSMPSTPVAPLVETKVPEPNTPAEPVQQPQGVQAPVPPAIPPATQPQPGSDQEDSTHHVA
jgi:LysM repeat protein